MATDGPMERCDPPVEVKVGKWDAYIEQLVSNPGEWFVLARHEAKVTLKDLANTFRNSARRRKVPVSFRIEVGVGEHLGKWELKVTKKEDT